MNLAANSSMDLDYSNSSNKLKFSATTINNLRCTEWRSVANLTCKSEGKIPMRS